MKDLKQVTKKDIYKQKIYFKDLDEIYKLEHTLKLFKNYCNIDNSKNIPFDKNNFLEFIIAFNITSTLENLPEEVEKIINNINSKDYKDTLYISSLCFEYIKDIINPVDLVFYHCKQKRNIYLKQLQYFLYKITKVILKERSLYSVLTFKYFTQKTNNRSFQDDFKKNTGQELNKHKLCAFYKLLTKYDIIKVYTSKNRCANIFCLGLNNVFIIKEPKINPLLNEYYLYTEIKKQNRFDILDINFEE